MKTAFQVIALVLLVAGASSAGVGQTASLVVLNCSDAPSMQQVVDEIEAGGGHVSHAFPPHVLIADLSDAGVQALSRDQRVDLITSSYTDPSGLPPEYGREARDAVYAWDQVYIVGPSAPDNTSELDLGAPLTDDARFAPDEGLPPIRPARPGISLAPPGAASWQTSEFMMGSVVVSLVLLESNGAIDTQTENWTPTQQSQVVSECLAGINWWISQYPYSVAPLSFTWEYHYGVPTGYEPIKRPSSDDSLWIADAMTDLGYSCTPATAYSTVRTYDNDLRNSYNKDWAYTIFVVDSSGAPGGTFTDGYFAYSYIGGPYLVMTYDNDGWGISRMDQVVAHETGHIFRAGDEYCQPGYSCCSSSSYYGYLKIQNTNCGTNPACLMNDDELALCSVTKQQIGWRDTDADGIPDILDVAPTATLTPYAPDPTTNTALTYTGSAAVGYYPDQLNPGYNVTVNRIANVQYRVDGGGWLNCTPTDGAFDGATEGYTFTTAPLSAGTHTLEARAVDTSGNVTAAPYPSDTVTVNAHTLTVTASAAPATVASGGATSLSASASDSLGHGIATWSWSDGGAGGSFSPSASVQNPSYTAAANTTDSNRIVTLTVTATCNGPVPATNSGSTTLTVQPVAHTLVVTANPPNPATVASGGSASLSASYSDSRTGHTIATWSWSDGGAGGASVHRRAYRIRATPRLRTPRIRIGS